MESPRDSAKVSLSQDLSVFVVSLLGGAAVWALSPRIAGDTEPFDRWGYYIPALLIIGLILGFAFANRLLPIFGGTVVGQVLYAVLFLRPLEGLFIVGFMFIVACGLFPLSAAAVGQALRLRLLLK